MKTNDLVAGLRTQHNINDVEIAAINGDVIGASLFINILLTVGAFLASFMLLGTISTFLWSMSGFDDEHIWIQLLSIAVVMIFIGYKSHSDKSIFALRMSTFFMVFGKLALIGLIIERIGAVYGYESLWQNIKYIAPLCLLLTILNLFISKNKLEAYILLVMGIVGTLYFTGEYSVLFGSYDRQTFAFGFGFWMVLAVWIWVIYMLMGMDMAYKYRLPFYAFIAAQMVLSSVLLFSGQNSLNLPLAAFVEQIILNLILLVPSLYLIKKLQSASDYGFGWQFGLTFLALILACILPIADIYILIFCFIFGYTRRDKYILYSAYILTPIYIYNLNYNLDLSLDNASLLAAIIGVTSLAAFVVVRYTKFAVKEV